MTKTIEEANKVLVLRAFDTLFNKRDYKTAERFWSPNFKTVAGFEHTYMWSTNGSLESDPDKVEEELPKSALPLANGSLLHIVTFPLAKTATFLDVGSFAGCSAVSQTPAGTRRYVRAGRIANARHPDCGLLSAGCARLLTTTIRAYIVSVSPLQSPKTRSTHGYPRYF